MDKSELMEKLSKSLEAIYWINNKQEEIEAAEEEINALDETVLQIQKTSAIPMFLKWLCTTFVLIFLVGKLFPQILETKNEAVSFLSTYSLVMGPLFFHYSGYRKKAKKSRELAASYKETTLPDLVKKRDELKRDLQKYATSKQAKLLQDTIPEDYTTIDAVSFFLLALKNQRADSLKEAINLYEIEQHNQMMLNMQENEMALLTQNIEISMQQLQQQEQIIKNQNFQIKQGQKLSKQVRFGNAVDIINTVKHWKD